MVNGMRNMNNKGFTLIELIATLVLLVLVMGLGAISITKTIENSKTKDYELLIKNIKDASEVYYQECKYGNIDSNIINGCDDLDNVELGTLVKYGYLTGNSKINDGTNKYTLVNPNDGESIIDCIIKINYDKDNGKVNVSAVNQTGSCPTSY